MAEEDGDGGEVDDGSFELGADLDPQEESSDASSPDALETQTEVDQANTAETPFDPMNVDWITLRDDQVPEEYKPMLKTARMFQSQADRARNEANQQVQQSNQAAEDLKTRMADLEVKYGPDPALDPTNQANNLIAQFGYQPGQDGYDEANVVHGIAQAVSQPLLDRLNALEAQNAQFEQHFQGQQSAHNRSIQDVAQNELNEAISDFGQEELTANWDAVKALRGAPNTRTGQPFTVSEALATVSPAVAAKAAKLRESGQQAVRTAQNGSRPGLSGAPPVLGDGDQSQGDLEATFKQLGFE